MSSGFRSFHPFPCFFFYMGALILGIVVTHPVYILTLLFLLIGLVALNGEMPALRGMLRFFLPVSLLYAMINPLFSHRGRHILFYFWDQPVTLESLVYGLFATVNLLVILVLFISFNAVITPARFLYLFGSVFPKMGLLIVMSMRFVPLLKRRLGEIASVQQTKGIDVGQGSLRKRVTDGMKLLQILLTLCLEEALETADAMKAKGYGSGPRGRYEEFVMRPRDWTLLAALLGLFAACIGFRLLGYGAYRIFPALETVTLHGWELLSYGCFALFAAVPIIIEGREMWLWRYWRSRM
ncbi:energy-coupling factor transporter transmembrane component T [Paenibacillus mucilaginosus]|uniref:energy-coupling factor transporter transmembrane component T n=1 Tax=Paenibacillus mucilaginosus TaxID=61624 RepID=UPI0003155745|nr:energy-coupling factor transporter transmembrane component T [Paenibacillus mucilaginosus]MCG7218163.1 energy-coupling factor transporter transmembrane protein EcfT [Paenibacillus mucilaginosus]WDM29679.1 cobalt ABC transporter permease [Paenibacillus mucilaginosus]